MPSLGSADLVVRAGTILQHRCRQGDHADVTKGQAISSEDPLRRQSLRGDQCLPPCTATLARRKSALHVREAPLSAAIRANSSSTRSAEAFVSVWSAMAAQSSSRTLNRSAPMGTPLVPCSPQRFARPLHVQPDPSVPLRVANRRWLVGDRRKSAILSSAPVQLRTEHRDEGTPPPLQEGGRTTR